MLDRSLVLEAVRVTEAAAIAAWQLPGRGDEKAADQAAVDAMRTALNSLDIDGKIVIGEGERDEAPMLYIGEKVGTGKGPRDRHRARSAGRHDPHRQGHGQCAGGDGLGARRARCSTRPTPTWTRSPAAPASRGRRSISTPSPADNVEGARQGQGRRRRPTSPSACSTGRATPRSSPACARVGARVLLITDGDVAGVINTAEPETGVDLYVGQGGAPEGVLACAALKCVGGQFQGRLVFRNDDERARAERLGPDRLRPASTPCTRSSGRCDLRRHRRDHAAPCWTACASTRASSPPTPWS